MQIRIKQVSLAVAFGLVLLLCLPMGASSLGPQTVVAAEVPSYRITDLGSLGYGSGQAFGINDHGQVVGVEMPSGERGYYPFLWTMEGGIVELSTLGGNQALASRINNYGQIVGWSTISGYVWPDGSHATIWTEDGEIKDLGVLSGDPQGNSMARDINDQGQVVGQTDIDPRPLFTWHAFLWTAESGMVDLGTLGGDYSEARAINELGQIVGRSATVDGEEHAFLITPIDMDGEGSLEWYWDADDDGANDLMMDLDPLDGWSWAKDINELGQIVGGRTSEDGNIHAFLWTREEGMQDLGTLGGISSWAWAINDEGYIVGSSATAAEEQHAFLWTAEEGMMNLETLGGTRSIALDINDFNHIVGSSCDPDGQNHAVGWWVEGCQTPAEAIEDLVDDVEDLNLPFGTENSLVRQLENALAVLETGNEKAARYLLRAFINHVEDLRGRQLTAEQADELIAAAQRIIENIG